MHQTMTSLLEDFADFNAHAKRQQRLIKQFTDDAPTAWDLAHADLDDLISEWQRGDA